MKLPNILPEVILGIPKNHDAAVNTLTTMATEAATSTYLTNAGPLAQALTAAIAPYDQAVKDAKNKIPGAVDARREARKLAVNAAEKLRANVQDAVNAHPELAATIVDGVKMKLRKVPAHSKADFAVTDGTVSGAALLKAKAVLRAILYFWEVSTNQTSWVVSDTPQAHTLISGLTVGQTYYFRFRARTRKGTTDYSQIISHVVR
jgi:hypothetical protein